MLNKRNKAHCAWGGCIRADQVRTLDHIHADIEHTMSQMFYALATAKGILIYSADVTNAFGDAPPPKQGLYILPDKAFQDW